MDCPITSELWRGSSATGLLLRPSDSSPRCSLPSACLSSMEGLTLLGNSCTQRKGFGFWSQADQLWNPPFLSISWVVMDKLGSGDLNVSLCQGELLWGHVTPPISVFIFLLELIGMLSVFSIKDFPSGSVSKETACSAGDAALILGLRRSPGEWDGYPLQYSCLGNPMDRGAWWATVHGVAKSWTWLSN